MPKALLKQSAYEGAVQQDGERLRLCRQLPTDFDIQAFMFRFICGLDGPTGVTIHRFAEEMYNASVRRMDRRSCSSKALSEDGGVKQHLNGDLG
jgi:hypothetical protein